MSHHSESSKRTFILKYLIPALGDHLIADTQKVEDIISRCGLTDVVKNQKIESPGPAMDGCLFLSISSMVHSYQYGYNTRRMYGTTIWKRRSLIFNSVSLLTNEPRTDFVQSLEQSEVLYITYPNLLSLMKNYEDIEDTIYRLSTMQAAYLVNKSSMRALGTVERVREFKANNPAFIDCTNQAMQAMHIGISLRTYTDQLKKIRESSNV